MRFATLLTVMAVALGSSAGLSAECNESRLQVLRARFFGVESPIASGLADLYLATTSPKPTPCESLEIKYEFLIDFFRGFREPDREVPLDCTNHLCTALRAGKQYRASHPQELDQVYASYGFVPVDIDGELESGFEMSRFSPAGSYAGEDWWIEGLPDARFNRPLCSGPGVMKRPAHVKGYASGPGTYGHLGAYRRYLYANEVSIRCPDL